MVYQSFHLFGLTLDNSFMAFVFSGTLCSYNFHWFLTGPPNDGMVSVKNQWNIRNRKLHLLLAFVSFVVAAVFLLRLRQHFIWLAGAACITFLYSAPKIPLRKTMWLRNIAYGKTIFLALAWTYITAMLPLLITIDIWYREHYLFCINRFFLIYAICILFDLRDRDRDRSEGIRSLVTHLELPAVHVLYRGVLVVFFLTTVWLLWFLPIYVIAALLIPGLIVAILYSWFRKQQSDFVYYFVLDGLMAFSLPLLLIFEF